MKTITAPQIAQLFRTFKSTFVSFVTETDPKVKVGGRGGVTKLIDLGYDPKKFTKVTRFVALVGTDIEYDKLVENRIDRKTEGSSDDWMRADRKWGERVDAIEVTHKGESYITAHFVSNNRPEVSYLYDGQPIDLKEKNLLSYLPTKSSSKKQADAGLEGALEVVHREYKAKGIKAFTIGGETYSVVG